MLASKPVLVSAKRSDNGKFSENNENIDVKCKSRFFFFFLQQEELFLRDLLLTGPTFSHCYLTIMSF